MTIEHVEAFPLARKLEQSYQGGTYKIVSRNTIVTRVVLENGVVGELYGGDEDRYQIEVCHLINEHFRPLLIGQDVRDIELLWQLMWNVRVDFYNRGIHSLDLAMHCIHSQAVAATDIALWDALGKLLEQPVYKLLGGYRDRVPAIAICGYTNKCTTVKDLEEEIGHYLDQGVAGVKLKVGSRCVDEDIERTRLVRRISDNQFHLCVDANQSWTVEQAMQFARGARDLKLAWIEEPVRWHDQHEGNARLRTMGIPIAAGQGEISRHGCRDLVTRGAVDILNVDATIAAGVTEWRRIAAMAACFNVTMAHHEEPQVALHLLAAVPHGLCVETFPDQQRDPMWFDLPQERPIVQNGKMLLPDAPGFGLTLSTDTIDKWRTDSPLTLLES